MMAENYYMLLNDRIMDISQRIYHIPHIAECTPTPKPIKRDWDIWLKELIMKERERENGTQREERKITIRLSRPLTWVF